MSVLRSPLFSFSLAGACVGLILLNDDELLRGTFAGLALLFAVDGLVALMRRARQVR